ncbi:MAG: hypothetical protein ACI9UD_000533 [Glaciecola sp.]|jgi:hypothetical protein
MELTTNITDIIGHSITVSAKRNLFIAKKATYLLLGSFLFFAKFIR